MIEPVREYVAQPRAARQRGARHRRRADARDARRARRRGALRRRRRARVPDPRRPRPRGRLLPQRRHPLVRQPRDRRARAGSAGDGHARTRCSRRSGCATCSSSSSSSRASASSATSCARSTRCWRSAGAFADRVLRSFLEAYWVVADRLCAHGDAPVEPEAIVKECLGVGRQYHLQGRIKSAEAVSSELFKTGLKLAANRGLIDRAAPAAPHSRPSSRNVLRPTVTADCWTRSRPPRAGAAPPPSSTSTAR